jgi:16S rRNA C967 or C1407 C5-methylase (RsmB/RsmF family)
VLPQIPGFYSKPMVRSPSTRETGDLASSGLPFTVLPPLDWQPNFIDRLEIAEKPGKQSLHDQGFYYCLDFSSVFAASVLRAIAAPCQTVVDVCASPGGKSIFAWRQLHPETLICNDAIGKRMGALVSNLKRCQVPGQPMNLDSKYLVADLRQSADVVIVDAPCTGQSLLAKHLKNPGCFHPININKNANRQKRILANSAQIVAPQGYLAYMTCAYSPAENEAVSTWFLEKFPQFQAIAIPHLNDYQSQLTEIPSYRIFPHTRLGAGAFTALFQNTKTG